MALVAIVTALTWRWTVAPDAEPLRTVGPADAVALFVGGRGERLVTAEALMARGAAPVLVIPHGTRIDWPDANRLCFGDPGYEVICPDPDPDTTRGEARTIGEIGSERGWTSIIYVTSTYHVARAGLLLGRCFDGSVVGVEAPVDLGTGDWVRRISHEWLGHLGARAWSRGC